MNAFSPSLEFFYFDAGGGHRSAATALQNVIAERFPNWRIEMINLQELLQPIDPMFRVTGIPSQDVYNTMIKRGWTYGSHAMLRGLQQGIKLCASQMEDLLQQHWEGSPRPDLVVSLIPNFNGVMFRALKQIHPNVPYVTIMTDLADYPPHFWQEKQDQYIICGSNKAVKQAHARGYHQEKIFQVSGMILKPGFYLNDARDRRLEREKLGLDPDLPTALIMFGGNGSKVSIKIVKGLKNSGFKLQSIVLCGNNEELREKLQKRKLCYTVGFTDNVPYYMRLADFFIGKPGPGSISEALHIGLPVIVERNKRTIPQERYNTEWLEKSKVGIVIKSFKRKRTRKAIELLLKDNTLEQFRQNAQRLNNRAVYEIPNVLERIISDSVESVRPQNIRDNLTLKTRPTGSCTKRMEI